MNLSLDPTPGLTGSTIIKMYKGTIIIKENSRISIQIDTTTVLAEDKLMIFCPIFKEGNQLAMRLIGLIKISLREATPLATKRANH